MRERERGFVHMLLIIFTFRRFDSNCDGPQTG